jgi:hypothetical protein
MQLFFPDGDSWRSWLAANHDKERAVWLIFHKAHRGRSGVPYETAVEEALCFGWVDSLIKRLDEDRYLRKFTPRTTPRGGGERQEAWLEVDCSHRRARRAGEWERRVADR